MTHISQIQRTVMLAISILLCISCGGTNVDQNRVPVHPVRGRVLVRGEPADNARIVFHSQDPGQRLNPHGRAGRDGIFHLSTYEMNDGAPAGDYTVTIVWCDPPPPGTAPEAPEGPDKLKGRYANPRTSPLHARIEPGDNKLEPIRIE